MKALTIKQPWADAIAHGSKRTENRTWTTRHRGPILIHAGMGFDLMGRLVIADWDLIDSWPDYRGAIIAVAELVDVHAEADCCKDWGQPNVYHWTLANVRALPEPVHTKGRQQLWTPAPAIIRAALDQVEEATS